MINLTTLQQTIDHFSYQRMTFSKEDYAFLLNRQTIATRLIDFLSKDYYQRKKLLDEGFIGVCYTYRINFSDGKGKNHRTFALFTPNQALMVDPDYFRRVISNIEKLRVSKHQSFKEKKFLNYYQFVDAKPQYYEIDTKLTEGKRVYLQYIEAIPIHCPNLSIGLNYVIYGPLISRELLYLPERLMMK